MIWNKHSYFFWKQNIHIFVHRFIHLYSQKRGEKQSNTALVSIIWAMFEWSAPSIENETSCIKSLSKKTFSIQCKHTHTHTQLLQSWHRHAQYYRVFIQFSALTAFVLTGCDCRHTNICDIWTVNSIILRCVHFQNNGSRVVSWYDNKIKISLHCWYLARHLGFSVLL